MKVSEVSSPQAVIQALEEFDSLGRKEYLSRYGFKPARRWYVEHDGFHYDSKAVLGGAYKHQFPEHHLKNRLNFFWGGRPTTGKLRELGFTVINADSTLGAPRIRRARAALAASADDAQIAPRDHG